MNILVCDDERLLLELYQSELQEIKDSHIYTAKDGVD